MKAFETYHAEFIEDQYQRWRKDPQSVPSDWQHFFSGFEIGEDLLENPGCQRFKHGQLIAFSGTDIFPIGIFGNKNPYFFAFCDHAGIGIDTAGWDLRRYEF